jgi:hypothetical protein
MENSPNIRTTVDQPMTGDLNVDTRMSAIHATNYVHPSQSDDQPCPTCSGPKNLDTVQYVYSIGKIQPRFPSISIEREFMQATGRNNTTGLTDSQAMHAVLSDPQNRYIAYKLCWVLTIEGMDTFLLQPLHSANIDMVIDSLRPSPKLSDVNVVIGVKGPIVSPQFCNGLQIPVVGFDQIYSFDIDSLIKSIPKPEKVSTKEFAPAAEELFMRIMQLADNAGALDEHRALNYVSVRYNAVYTTTADCFARNFSLTGVEVIPSRLNGTRRILDVILSFTSRTTDVTEKYFCRVDVTEEFPFLVTKMQAYFDR